MFFYLHCGRGFSRLYGGRTNRCLISWALCDNSGNTLGQHKATLHTFVYDTSLHAPCWTHVASAFRLTAARPVLIMTCIKSSDVGRRLGWSPYRHGWSWLMPSSCQHLSDKGESLFSLTVPQQEIFFWAKSSNRSGEEKKLSMYSLWPNPSTPTLTDLSL